MKLRKLITYSLLALAGLMVVLVVIAFLLYPAEYLWRQIRWGEADVYDYQKFPARALMEATVPFAFAPEPQEDLIRSAAAQEDIEDLERFLSEAGTQAFLVIQDDRVLYEGYFNGAQRDSIVTSFSVAKSFVSALVGIAIEEGYIGSVHDPITHYLPELKELDTRFEAITIEDLLRMSSGTHYRETGFINGDDAKTYYWPDLRELALTQTVIDGPPGEVFLYNNYHLLLLGLILERSTGRTVTEYLNEKIWQLLGMEFGGSWSLDERGFEKMESGINARAIDFAKFGRLYLHGGNWQGAQVVPAAWAAASTAPYEPEQAGYYPDYPLFANGGYYGYLWWGFRRDEGEYDFAALGNHGQIIYVSPSKSLVIVRNGERYGVDIKAWLDFLYGLSNRLPEPVREVALP